jgi:hypothetical protein
MTQWLWRANLIGTLVTAAATIAQPILIESVPAGPDDDPHGYILVFSVGLALGVLTIVIVASALLAERNKAGMVTSFGAAACCAGLAYLSEGLLPASSLPTIIAVELLPAALAVLGLYAAPPPQPKPALTNQPHPPPNPS